MRYLPPSRTDSQSWPGRHTVSITPATQHQAHVRDSTSSPSEQTPSLGLVTTWSASTLQHNTKNTSSVHLHPLGKMLVDYTAIGGVGVGGGGVDTEKKQTDKQTTAFGIFNSLLFSSLWLVLPGLRGASERQALISSGPSHQ